ncbi:MAG: WD40 repeat domain-containing protein, partial [Actinobacteria bacterium]
AVPTASSTAAPDETNSGMQIWDVQTRRLVRFIPSPKAVLSSAAWSRDGTILIAQGNALLPDRPPPTIAIVWDTGTWQRRHGEWRLSEEYVGDRKLAVSGDAHRLALPLPDGSVQVWDVETRKPIGAPVQPAELLGRDAKEVSALALSADGSLLAVGTVAGPVLVVDTAKVEFSSDADLVAVGRLDGRTQLFDRAAATALGEPLAANASRINDVSFSPDGSVLATAGLDRTGALWSLDGRRAIAVPLDGQRGVVAEAVYTSDGQLLTVAADGTVAQRDGSTGRIIRTLRLKGEALTVASDPREPLMAAGGTRSPVRIWRRDNGAPAASIDVGASWVYSVAFSPDGSVLAITVDHTGGNLESTPGPVVGVVRFIDPHTGRDIGHPISYDNGPPISLSWSPDGRLLAVATADNFLHVYDARTRRAVVDTIENVDAKYLDVAFSNDGTRVVTGTGGGAVRQWDARTGKEIPPALEGQVGDVAGVGYSPDGRMLATTAFGLSTTRLWEMPAGRPIGADLVGGR